jgi:hypothetical protein
MKALAEPVAHEKRVLAESRRKTPMTPTPALPASGEGEILQPTFAAQGKAALA